MPVRHCLKALTLLVVLGWVGACWIGHASASDAALCRQAVAMAETTQHLPDAFLSAIARVESGRPDPATGTRAAWPWTINAEGRGAFFDSAAEAISAVRALQARGVRSIDVGCMQVNLMHHPEAFASLEQAFDPQANAVFAGQLLTSLFARTGSWPRAAAAYHSQTPTIGAAYQQRVLEEWAVPETGGRASQPVVASRVARPPPASLTPSATATPQFGGSAIGRSVAFSGRALPGVAGLASTGRSLATYRAMPTALALRLPPRSG